MRVGDQLRACWSGAAASARESVSKPCQLLPAAALGLLPLALDPFALVKSLGFAGAMLLFVLCETAFHAAYAACVEPSFRAPGRFAAVLAVLAVAPILGYLAGTLGLAARLVALVVAGLGLPALRTGGPVSAFALGARRAADAPAAVVAAAAAIGLLPLAVQMAAGWLHKGFPGEIPAPVLLATFWANGFVGGLIAQWIAIGRGLREP